MPGYGEQEICSLSNMGACHCDRIHDVLTDSRRRRFHQRANTYPEPSASSLKASPPEIPMRISPRR